MEITTRLSAGAADPAPLAVETMRAPWFLVDGFLAESDALAMRAAFEAHFADPRNHQAETHQLWNYWYVPGTYTYLRTAPEKVLGEEISRRFHAALTDFAVERLGMGHVTKPNLSLYVDGCWQGLHNDSANGRFAYVYSLTPDSRRSFGGETLVLKEGDAFRSNLREAKAGPGLHDLIAPLFNRLTIFDDRMPHGVQRVEGSMDPLDGRVVLHGHISEDLPRVAGPLPAREMWEAVGPDLDAAVRAADPHGIHLGPLVLRAAIGADGRVREAAVLVDRVARSDGGDASAAVQAVLAAVRAAGFPAGTAASVATLPVMFGGPLPWMKKPQPGIVASRVTAASTVRPAILAPEAPRPEPMFKPFAPTGARPVAPAQPPARPPHPRASIGAAVRERFAADPSVRPIPKPMLEAFVVPDFVSPEECEGLIALIDAGCVPSGLMAPTPDPEFRTSSTCNLNPADLLVARIESRLNRLFGIDPHHGETIQGQRYAVGQQFKPHHDFFHEDQPYWPPQEKHGGQRTWTAMAFLNLPEAGGQTMFPKAGLRITPALGYLLVWNNMDRDGYPNDFSLHQGCPVEAGTKYVLTKWYRERPWSPVV